MVKELNQQWLPLRQDIRLLSDAYTWFGKASYQLLDPANNRFYKLGALEFEILKYWELQSAQEIVKQVNKHSHFHIVEEDVNAVYEFLNNKGLLQTSGQEKADSLITRKKQSKQGWFSTLSKKYLFLRIPLFKPDKAITRFYNAIKPFLTVKLLWLSILLVLLGAIGVLREWEYYSDYFALLLTPKGAFYAVIAIIVSKLVHEIAHATAIKHFGCKVYYMGVALIVLLPMLWTDASDSWRLKDNRQRMWINGIGVIAELLLAGIASLFWVLLPEGNLKFIAFVLSGVTWIGTLFINLNPFMKFDGYHLLLDAVKTPNLQTRSIAVSIALLREKIFGWKQAPEENLSTTQHRWFLVYGLGCLIYRFFLYVSIALIVYHMLPSPYGMMLAGIEVYWFLLFPLYKELALVCSHKSEWLHTMRFKLSAAFIVFILIMLLLPTSRNIEGDAMLHAENEVTLSVAKPAKLTAINAQNFKAVKKGDLLFEVESPQLKKEAEQLHATAERLENEYRHYLVSNDPKVRNDAFYIKEELNATLSRQKNNQQEQASLQVIAPMGGVLRDVPDYLALGDWLEKKELLGRIASDEFKVEAFVSEYDVGRLEVGDKAVFYPKHVGMSPIHLKVKAISQTNVQTMPFLELTVPYGGNIEMEKEGNQEYVKQSLFKVTLVPVDEYAKLQQLLTGEVVIKGDYQSPISHIAAKTYALFLREFSF